MRIILINPKSDFTSKQIQQMKKAGELVVFEKPPSYKEKAFTDNKEKVIALKPKLIDWKFPDKLIKSIKNIKSICIPTTGFGWINGKLMRKYNINLTNVPKYSTESVAEYAISLMFNLAKKLPLLIKNNWKIDEEKHQGWEVKRKTMGVIGLGAIGTRIGELGKSMGMNVVYWSKNSRNKKFKYLSLDNVLKKSDFIFPALARNSQTKNLLNKDKLNQMKKGSFIVSITGDDIFDFDHARKLVKQKKLAGVALESNKYTINNFELKNFKGNIWVTPPIAWFTKEAFKENMRIFSETIVSSAKGNPKNIVN